MSRRKRKKQKSWVDVFQSERKTFPPGLCVTKVIPDKRKKKPKHKQRMDDIDNG